MAQGKAVTKISRSVGDTAVDGLLRGVVAGVLMAIVLAAAGLLAQLPAQFVLARFDPTASGSATAGLLAHLATAGIYGVLFALITAPVSGRLGVRMILAGLAYGIILLLVSRALMATELGAPLRALPSAGWSLAHVVYGLSLGWLMAERQ